MSWLSDVASNIYKGYSDVGKFTWSLGGLAENDLSRFWENESNKSQLRGAQIEAGISGIPGVSDVIRGIEGINKMEDLYNNTGKVVRYPGSDTLGASGLGHSIPSLDRKIEDGSHDLAHFYSGDPQMMDWTHWNKNERQLTNMASDVAFRKFSRGWNER